MQSEKEVIGIPTLFNIDRQCRREEVIGTEKMCRQ